MRLPRFRFTIRHVTMVVLILALGIAYARFVVADYRAVWTKQIGIPMADITNIKEYQQAERRRETVELIKRDAFRSFFGVIALVAICFFAKAVIHHPEFRKKT